MEELMLLVSGIFIIVLISGVIQENLGTIWTTNFLAFIPFIIAYIDTRTEETTNLHYFLYGLAFLIFIAGVSSHVYRAYMDKKEEKKREDAVKSLQNNYKEGQNPLVIGSISNVTFSLSSPNSVGGRDVRFYYTNESNKVIKYLTWYGSFKNAVGDYVSCTFRNYYIYRGKDTGPVKQYGRGGGFWGTVIYNYQATKMELSRIDIEYMDGSKLEIKGDELLLIGLKEYQIRQS